MIYYSRQAEGFFDDAIHRSIPADAVQISSELHRDLLHGQSHGLLIVAGGDGHPRLEPHVLSNQQRLVDLRNQRDRLLTASDWSQMPDVPLSPVHREAWVSYRQALRDLPETFAADPGAAVWPVPPVGEGTAA